MAQGPVWMFFREEENSCPYWDLNPDGRLDSTTIRQSRLLHMAIKTSAVTMGYEYSSFYWGTKCNPLGRPWTFLTLYGTPLLVYEPQRSEKIPVTTNILLGIRLLTF